MSTFRHFWLNRLTKRPTTPDYRALVEARRYRRAPDVERMIEDDTNTIQLSHACVWEMSIKAGLGKLSLSTPVLDFVQDECRKNRIQLLPISLSAIGRVERLRRHHGDPFDRLLAAECLVREEPIISADKIFGKYAVKRIWR